MSAYPYPYPLVPLPATPGGSLDPCPSLLSLCVADEKQDTEHHFSGDDLWQLFLFKEHILCETHDTFKCKWCRDRKQIIKALALLYGDASM